MQANKVIEFLDTVDRFYLGEASVWDLALCLDTSPIKLQALMLAAGVAGLDGRADEHIQREQLLYAILLIIAMRSSIFKPT